MTILPEIAPVTGARFGIQTHPADPRAIASCTPHTAPTISILWSSLYRAETRQRVILLDLNWEHCIRQLKFFGLNMFRNNWKCWVLILGSLINFSKLVNSQKWNPQIVKIDHVCLWYYLWNDCNNSIRNLDGKINKLLILNGISINFMEISNASVFKFSPRPLNCIIMIFLPD